MHVNTESVFWLSFPPSPYNTVKDKILFSINISNYAFRLNFRHVSVYIWIVSQMNLMQVFEPILLAHIIKLNDLELMQWIIGWILEQNKVGHFYWKRHQFKSVLSFTSLFMQIVSNTTWFSFFGQLQFQRFKKIIYSGTRLLAAYDLFFSESEVGTWFIQFRWEK